MIGVHLNLLILSITKARPSHSLHDLCGFTCSIHGSDVHCAYPSGDLWVSVFFCMSTSLTHLSLVESKLVCNNCA